ncbi:MAG TPA: phosphohistidine phosphatase SixA [Candidatus Eisenbacteria bacterium]|nr:phosphohistidine phosphatase SixA [Candidatus Eisenbacteria bacterium]
MNLLIVRHAIAVERGDPAYPYDDDRPLTTEGIHKFRLAARGLKELGVRPERIVSSPLVRARQTAEILRDTVAPDLDLTIEPHLEPGADFEATARVLLPLPEETVAIVGHEPHVSGFTAYLLAGPRARAGLLFKKGAAALVTFHGQPQPGGGTLEWLLQPGALRALAGH